MVTALMASDKGETGQTMFDPDRQTLVVGLGNTGLSCVRFLASKGVPVAIVDSRDNPPKLEILREELPDVAVFVGGFSEEAFASAEQLIVSPGVSLKESAIQMASGRGLSVMGDIELFAYYAKAPVIAITGTNGKSTVTSLVGLMVEQSGKEVRVGGNIGKPALELLEENNEPDFYVLELSSFQLETTHSLNATVATVLNIAPDHMDRYDSIQDYIVTKQHVYNGDGVMVINRDDVAVVALTNANRNTVRFGLDEPVAGEFGLRNVEDQIWLALGDDNLINTNELKICGKHNFANALAALAISHSIGCSKNAMLDVLRRFTGLPHRMQWVVRKNNVVWFNDSKGTNPGATVAALNGTNEKVVLIAGGDGKDADFTPLREAVTGHCRAVVLIGRDAPQIEKILSGLITMVNADDMKDAVHKASELAQSGDVVLLSPACASFDMFTDYQARGNAFINAVQELPQ